MNQSSPTKYRKDYKPANFIIEQINLHIDLAEEQTQVSSQIQIKRHPSAEKSAALILNGKDQILLSVKIDGRLLESSEYQLDEEHLTLKNVPDSFQLEINSASQPQNNTSLIGLYKSNGVFCTQCESEGFQKITYYLDRPDVMASFTTTIVADKKAYPVLLSNGNLIASGDKEAGRHYATWQDPFKKPCYLFALVAGNLGCLEDCFTTMSGKKVTLRIFSEHKNTDKLDYAMIALKKAMRWDEEQYGREYDLDIFMIVAVDDFNFGAMENKGLNIFNSQYILARPETATDSDYAGIDTVVSHEYFHNWTGNRITVRDWFQLTLKEGLTVFRDHSFSQDVGFADVVRINQVKHLRAFQFPEDAGPLAHPIRPDSYIEMANFYTSTVYEKGSEVIRMQHTLLGKAGYRKGMDLYFERHDGAAVTCEDFVKAMEDANQVDFSQMRRWYEQAGTPELSIKTDYDQDKKTYRVTVTQHCPATPGQPNKPLFQIPLKMGLLDKQGHNLKLKLHQHTEELHESVLNITQQEESFSFVNINEKPTPSWLRGFSAPVKVHYDYSNEDLAFLMQHDSDVFAKWEAAQTLGVREILQLVKQAQENKTFSQESALIKVQEQLAKNKQIDRVVLATMLELPTQAYIYEQMSTIDVDAVYLAQAHLKHSLAEKLEVQLKMIYENNHSTKIFQYTKEDAAQRKLKNICLAYLALLNKSEYFDLAMQQFSTANNMTDQLSALHILLSQDNAHQAVAVEQFYQQWHHEALVLDKWFSAQASSNADNLLEKIQSLLEHADFNIKNPNRVRSVLGGFTANLRHFHAISGEGYRILTDKLIILDALNPMVAARLTTPLTRWRPFDEHRKELMRAQLERLAQQKLSKNMYEVVSKSLAKE